VPAWLHYAPAKGWMNDPNGLIHDNGRHHLIYQYNPDGTEFTNQHWGHASSRTCSPGPSTRWHRFPARPRGRPLAATRRRRPPRPRSLDLRAVLSRPLAARVDLASAYALTGHLDAACTTLGETYERLRQSGNLRGISRARRAREGLNRWISEPIVQELDRRMAAA
jgi:hypothetical protein